MLIVKASKPDLVILDVMMPELDGHEVCRTLRADPDTRALPIIILTGKSPVTAHQVSERVGASAHMSKPFSWRQLAEKIRALLA